jgi:hypothetical protein
MTRSISPPSRYWVVQKDGTAVQRHETVADDLDTISYEIPESCDAVALSAAELRRAVPDHSVLSDHEKRVLGLSASRPGP